MTATGDEDAFRELTDPYRRELQVHCYRILGSSQDAEDLVQETLLAAWRGFDAFEGRSSVRAWLYRIATNRCLNALRDRARRPREVPAMVEPPEPTRRTEPIWLEPYPDVAPGGHPGPLPGPGGPLRGQGGGRAGVHQRPSEHAAEPARRARAARRARLPNRRGRRHARHRRDLGQGRPPARPSDARSAPAGRRPRARPAARLRPRARNWSAASPTPSRAATSTTSSRCSPTTPCSRCRPSRSSTRDPSAIARLPSPPRGAPRRSRCGWCPPGPTPSRRSAATCRTRRRRSPAPTGMIVLTLEGDAVAAITWFADTGVFRHFGLPRTLPSP